MSIVRVVGVAVVALLLGGVSGAGAQPQEAGLPASAIPAAPENPYTPPACTGVFTDVACPGGFAVNWIEQFYNDGITSGCNAAPLEYCPDASVTRAQMAVFVEKAMRGTSAWSPGDLGSGNTGLGSHALLNNPAYSQDNTAVGYQALYTQSFANGNVAFPAYNTAVGVSALFANQPDGGTLGFNGRYNTAVGSGSLNGNTQGFYNTALGFLAGGSQVTGANNTLVGAYADAVSGALENATAVGASAVVDASNHVRIGDTNVTQIGGQVAWSNLSDARAKTDIRNLDLGLDFVLALRPVSFTMKAGNGRTDMGFVAQDVEALLGDGYNVLGVGGDADRTLSLRYTDLIAPMVRAIQEQQATIAAQKAAIEALRSQHEALLARMAKIEASVARR